jgi:thiopeptide-type bacteriocin biosynthesis protein
VRVGKLVLALAQWQATKEELEPLGKLKDAALFRHVQKWRAERRLPRYFTLADGDNELPVDLDNILSIEAFAQMVHTRSQATLHEFYPAPTHLCAYGPEGAFTHEIVVPFVKADEGVKGRADEGVKGRKGEEVTRSALSSHPFTPSPLHPFTSSPRRFAPGSAWLYAKLYTGTATADRVLKGVVREVVDEVQRREAARHWFFLRYSDPDWHIRLRFRGEPERLRGEVQPLLEDAARPWLESGALWRVQYDTYEREMERYGGAAGISLAEQFFHADSDAVLRIIEMLEPGAAGLDERWRLVCAGIDMLLNDFGLSLKEKYELLRGVRDGFAREHHADKNFHGRLGEKYRQERKALGELLEYSDTHPLAPGFEVFRQRSQALAPLSEQLRAATLTASVNDILASYLHLHANRLLRSAQRQQELVLYDLLTRHYDSLLARKKVGE